MGCAFFFVPFFYFLKKLSFRVDKKFYTPISKFVFLLR